VIHIWALSGRDTDNRRYTSLLPFLFLSLDSETEVNLGPPARPKSVVSQGDQERNCGSVDRSVEGNDAPTEFDDTSRSRVAKKQSRMKQCNSRVTGRSAMAPSKNSSSTDRRSRNRGEHRTGEFPNSSFRGVDSGRVRYDRTVDRPDRGEDRRRPVDSRGVQKEKLEICFQTST